MSVIEYASRDYAHADQETVREVLRVKLRGAPLHIKRLFPGVFPDLAKRDGTSVATPPRSRLSKPAPALSPTIGYLVGTVAPGLSVPVATSVDTRKVPEFFARDAWQSILDDITWYSRSVELRIGHYGKAVASTDRQTLRFKVHPVVGLTFVATCRGDDATRGLWFNEIPSAGCDVSVGFRFVKSELVSFRGQTVRLIRHARLDHVAVVLPGSGVRGAYASAVCLPVRGDSAKALRSATEEVQNRAWTLSKKSVRLTDLWTIA